MKLTDFDYKLPKKLIAQKQIYPRDHSRLLVYNKSKDTIFDDRFYNIYKYLKAGDLLVLNDSKVFKARLLGYKKGSLGKVEILLSRQMSEYVWEAIGHNLKVSADIRFKNSSLECRVIKKINDQYVIKFNMKGSFFWEELKKIGQTPLPPYIRRVEYSLNERKRDQNNYQTVYAKARGSIAAPTAGLHFSDNLLNKIMKKGIKIEKITLHVGIGTFQPIKSKKIADHTMHKEYYSVKPKTISNIIRTRRKRGRIVAVGTTTIRVLETIFKQKIFSDQGKENKKTFSGFTDIFITPGYKFKYLDGIITNFHLPKSTLIILISAYIGRKKTIQIYEYAISQKYRFYSFGDAMLII